MEETNKIYAILYKAYEIDDIDIGDSDIIFCSLSKENVDSEYKHLYDINKRFYNEKSTEDDFFEEMNNSFSFSVGKWIYDYSKVEYELDKNLRWNR